jgi:hypothetical protein
MILTRRSVLALAGAGFAGWGRLYAGTADFWNRKDPAEWSSEEIQKLMTKSPWAKEVRAESSKTVKDPGAVADPSTMPGSQYPGTGKQSRANMGLGNPRGMGKGGKTPSGKLITSYTGTVLWESARPIRDALKTPLPDEFAGQYVLSVNGVPLVKPKADDDGTGMASHGALEKLKGMTTLRVKGKDPSQPGMAQQQTGNGAVYLFGFTRESLAIAKDDKELLFETHMGKLVFTAKFSPKEMLYHGELAI